MRKKMENVSSFVVTSLYLLCLCNHFFEVSSHCLSDQSILLHQLKNNLRYSKGTNQMDAEPTIINWPPFGNASDDCCRWRGVTCDKDGHVIGIDLSGESISGGVFDNSSSIFSFQHLQYLNLASNHFASEFPYGFHKLKKLTYLNLSEAGFVGQIPIEISQLTRLVTLDLSFSNYPGVVILENPNLRKLVQNLTRIKQLYLDGVDISEPGHEWNNVLLSLHDLQELSMSGCSLSGPLDHSLARLNNLSVIVLDWNNLSSPVPETFSHFKNLKTLSLQNCGLTGTFPKKIFNIVTLSLIDISANNLHGFPGEYLHSIGNITKLSHIYLQYNNFNGSMASSNFEGLHNLISIDLSYNSLTGCIPSSLFTLPQLQSIQLSHNQFSQLGEFINVSSSILDTLDLSSNNIPGPFPTSIFQLRILSSLKLSSNKFNGSVQLNKIFDEFDSLTELDLSHNNFSVNMNGINVDPSSFFTISKLKLASCHLKTFPGFLRNFATLTSLDLSDNQIQRTVPDWIWNLYNLQILNLSYNLFTDLGNVRTLPVSMLSLDLHHNKLQGPIPAFPLYSKYMDFSSNKFSSIIPWDTGTYNKVVSLSNNSLHGSIPDFICDSELRVLDLSINNLSGTIPSCLMKKYSLEVLNLKNNNLSGLIPGVDNVCGLWTLNLHGNLLDGPIPKSFADCSKLEVLDLGSNQIIDDFPCFLKEISTLRILILRNNKFQGSLSCSEASKTWKMLQIMDIAFNNFTGKLPGEYFTPRKRNIIHKENKSESEIIGKWFNDPSGNLYYQYSVTVIIKGLQLEFVKILTIFTSIDFSSNHFEGPIPHGLMDFEELYFLNLSNNALSGEIPSSIGKLRQLESLDLSQNSLSGEIPMQLASLTFLSYLNLSFNHLVGKIPSSTQLQTFPISSFEGNDGSYGPPLTENIDGKEPPKVLSQPKCGRLACTIDWNFISVELGLVFGHGIVFGPLLIWKRWRIWYWKVVHKILCWIFPQLHLEYITHRGQAYETLRWRH